ncbi:YgaB family protein [Ectobacillus ponti]|uniref:Stress-induced protein n=1 Tax=Ectobacillus ponti TaxID=2961894 RepID=A0AA42BRI4_9BACI|nr:YgaB family protein [Ectobacillus ponti]MCP8970977.1 hypothetical protein [Ectobacillus ponti]
MNEFDRLVGEQLRTMDQLLDLQLELERCQQLEQTYMKQNDAAGLQQVQENLRQKKETLLHVQQVFEAQTQQVIHSFQQEKVHM